MAPTAIISSLPVDNSLTCQLIHEGLLYAIREKRIQIKEPMHIDVPEDLLMTVYNGLEEERLRSVELSMAGNDVKNEERVPPVGKFIKSLNITTDQKVKNYASLLRILKENSERLPRITRDISVRLNITGDSVLIGDINNKEDGVALQLFKVERYMGITSTELHFTTKQIGTYLSREVLLLSLLGIYSSFVTKVSERGNTYYYFLLFDAGEVIRMLRGESDIQTLFLLKEKVRDELAKVIRSHYSEELVLCELVVNATLQQLFRSYNITSLSLLLGRIAREGQTYKIYQILPITVYRREYSELYGLLNDVLNVIRTRLNNPSNPEYSNLILIVNGIYRFLILGDVHGLYILSRELLNALNKLDTSKPSESKAAQGYARIIRELSRLENHV